MDYFKTCKINDSIYQFKDKLGVLTTLVIGEKYALLVDTAYGIGDLKSHIRKFTDLPLIVIDSHGHMDHCGGNYQFDQVYINEKDYNLCCLHTSLAWRTRDLATAKSLNVLPDNFDEENYLKQGSGNLTFLKDNASFDLGGINCKVIPMEGHTKGSVGVYLDEFKILIVTDATCPFVWLFLEESTTVKTYIEMLERTLELPFEYILLGHGTGELNNRSRVIDFLNIAKAINLKESVKVTFNHFENLNSYCFTYDTMYDQSGCGVVFDPDKLN